MWRTASGGLPGPPLACCFPRRTSRVSRRRRLSSLESRTHRDTPGRVGSRREASQSAPHPAALARTSVPPGGQRLPTLPLAGCALVPSKNEHRPRLPWHGTVRNPVRPARNTIRGPTTRSRDRRSGWENGRGRGSHALVLGLAGHPGSASPALACPEPAA